MLASDVTNNSDEDFFTQVQEKWEILETIHSKLILKLNLSKNNVGY